MLPEDILPYFYDDVLELAVRGFFVVSALYIKLLMMVKGQVYV